MNCTNYFFQQGRKCEAASKHMFCMGWLHIARVQVRQLNVNVQIPKDKQLRLLKYIRKSMWIGLVFVCLSYNSIVITITWLWATGLFFFTASRMVLGPNEPHIKWALVPLSP